jgi:hypothetical protein
MSFVDCDYIAVFLNCCLLLLFKLFLNVVNYVQKIFVKWTHDAIARWVTALSTNNRLGWKCIKVASLLADPAKIIILLYCFSVYLNLNF